ncbi:MAG: nitrate reductase gamma subunit [Bacteriovoracaceae bacterium]|jgi:hypothetical protein
MGKKLVFAILLAAGLGLIFFGYNESTSITSRVSKAVIGSHSNKIMFCYIGGGIFSFLGLFGLLRK